MLIRWSSHLLCLCVRRADVATRGWPRFLYFLSCNTGSNEETARGDIESLKRGVIPLLYYMEEHIWTDSETGGDVWNGRWTPHTLCSQLGDTSLLPIERRDFQKTLTWLQKLTGILQNVQRAIYGVWHTESLSMEAKAPEQRSSPCNGSEKGDFRSNPL